jgi:outer membrane protein
MKRIWMAVAVSMLGMVAVDAQAQAQDGSWLVRARITRLGTADKSAPLGGIGAADRITVADKTIPELDISYFFTPHLAAELVLTIPQKHDVRLDGGVIGSFKHLPPTLLAQYRFDALGQVTPYLGAGVNFTRIGSVHLLNGAGGLENHSIGLALQAGADYRIDQKWSANVDIKRVNIRSDVTVSGAVVSQVKVDPLLVSVGIGYRF